MNDISDISSLLSMLNDKNKNIDLSSLINNMSNSSNDSKNVSTNSDSTPSLDEILYNTSKNVKIDASNKSSNDNFQMPDMDSIMKIIKIMNSINSNTNNPSANLLYSLKPFLRDSKKEKVDQYVKFLKISSVISEINKSGGDLK